MSGATPSPGPEPATLPLLRTPYGWALVLVSGLLLFTQLGAGSLANGDDAVYGWAVRDMIERGGWLDYRWYDSRLYSVYPPLHFWALGVSATLFGVTEFALRLPAALAGFSVVLMLGSLVARATRLPAAGLFAGLFLLCGATFYEATRSVRLDMTFLAGGLAVYWAYVRALEDRRWFVWLGVFAGLAFLVKTYMVVFVLLPLVLDVAVNRRALLKAPAAYLSAAVFLVFAGGWFFSLWARGLPLFADISQRVVSGYSGLDHSFVGTMTQIAGVEGAANLLWGVGAGWLVWRWRDLALARLFALAVVAGLLILGASSTVMPHYALSLFVPLAAGAGGALGQLLERRRHLVPVAVVAALGLFITVNAEPLLDPDFSPGVQEIAEKTRALDPARPVVFFRGYNASFDFYMNERTRLVTDTQASYDRYAAYPIMRVGPGLELLQGDALRARLTQPGAAAVTFLPFEEALARQYAGLAITPDSAKAGAFVLFHVPR